MRKHISLFILFISILLIFSLTGCTQNQDDGDQAAFPDIEFGYNLVDWDKTIQYEGEPIAFTFELNNNEYKAEFGLMVFIDGKIQKFTTTEYENPDYMHNYFLQSKECKAIQISLLPQNLKKGEYDLTVIMLLNPNFIAEEPNYVFGYNHKISYAYTRININTETTTSKTLTVEDSFAISESEKNNYVNDDGSNRLEMRAYGVILNDGAEENRKIYLNNNDLNIDFKILGGDNAQYRITAFLNNKPILTNNEYNDSVLESSIDKYSLMNLKYSNKDLKETNVIYFIALPINETKETAYPIKTDSIVIVK